MPTRSITARNRSGAILTRKIRKAGSEEVARPWPAASDSGQGYFSGVRHRHQTADCLAASRIPDNLNRAAASYTAAVGWVPLSARASSAWVAARQSGAWVMALTTAILPTPVAKTSGARASEMPPIATVEMPSSRAR